METQEKRFTIDVRYCHTPTLKIGQCKKVDKTEMFLILDKIQEYGILVNLPKETAYFIKCIDNDAKYRYYELEAYIGYEKILGINFKKLN